MERYQRGHQQPVEGARPVSALLVLACAVVAVAVAVWGLNAARQQRLGVAADAGSGSAAASQKDDARDADDANAVVTAQTFLQALDERADAATGSPANNAVAVRLAWSECRPMTDGGYAAFLSRGAYGATCSERLSRHQGQRVGRHRA